MQDDQRCPQWGHDSLFVRVHQQPRWDNHSDMENMYDRMSPEPTATAAVQVMVHSINRLCIHQRCHQQVGEICFVH